MAAFRKNIYGLITSKSFLDDERIGYVDDRRIITDENLVFRGIAPPGGGSTVPIYVEVLPFVKLQNPTVSTTSVTINFDLYNAVYDLTFPNPAISGWVMSRIGTANIYYKTANAPSYQTKSLSVIYTTKADGTNNTKQFTVDLTNLQANTDYVYYLRFEYSKLYSEVAGGGSNRTATLSSSQDYVALNKNIFKTVQVVTLYPPTITTISTSSITQTGALSGGNISSGGGDTIVEMGVVYGTSPNPAISVGGSIKLMAAVTRTIATTGIGAFSLSITGLSPSTIYYISAYAINNIGTSYGSAVSFTTLSVPANTPVTISTNVVSAITTNSAASGVNITEFGNSTISAIGIVWGTSDANLSISINSGIHTYAGALLTSSTIRILENMPITGLTTNTKYYVKAYATNSAGTVYGNTRSFTTFDVLAPGEYRLPTDGVNWYQLYKNWEFVESSITNSKVPFLRVSNSARKDIIHPISYYFSATFSSSKNYQFRTLVENFYDIYGTEGYVGKSNGASFSMRTPWGQEFKYPVPYFHESANPNLFPINLYFYGTLPAKANTYIFKSEVASSDQGITAQNPITYTANHLFGSSDTGFITDNQSEGLSDVRVNELSWTIQGFSFFTFNLYSDPEAFFSGSYFGGKGWHYGRNGGVFTWFDRYSSASPVSVRPSFGSPTAISLSENDKNNPVGGDAGEEASNPAYRANNYIAKYIPYQNFNISFTFKNERQDIGIKIYLSPTLPTSSAASTDIVPKDSTLIASMTQSRFADEYGTMQYGVDQPCIFVGLEGNQYIYIVGDSVPASAASTYSICQVKDIRLSGGYHSGNNQKYLMDISGGKITSPIFTSATYSTLIGSGNTVNASDTLTIVPISAKIGNGVFNSGVWENGVWNSGWREDTEICDFYRIDKFFSMIRDKKWRVQISGPASSVSNFKEGDRVSISNIVAIDLNENRKLLKKYFTIIEKTDSYLVVEFENEFPLRRIEIDSNEHRIMITKNVWLSGTFFNGYFKGIWNYGLFAGYPFLTKMEDTHWIDGIFTGGHFYADKYNIAYSKTVRSDYSNSKRVGLTFSRPHMLTTGDIITILGTPDFGETVIVAVPDEYTLVTGIGWKKEYETATGTVYTLISSGLIQNFDFRANNVSKMTSLKSMDSTVVFSYNSWIDVNYSDKSAVNIGKPQSLLDALSRRNYSENNLYGYVTTDILSSKSSFRDSFSNTVRDYRLGTKYKIFTDYVGDSSSFDEYFDPTDTDAGMESFSAQGWEFSKDPASYLTFSRTKEPLDGSTTTIGKELHVYAKDKGGVLNLATAYDIPNRTNGEVGKSRYTLVEFDLMTYSVSGESYIDSANELATQPPIHFGNLNYVSRNDKNGQSKQMATSYLPVYENVNHLKTGDNKKQEFFFNKRNLMMNFRGTGALGTASAEYFIDGLKLYEVDMVPFFQYFRNNNINKSIQNPYQAIAPVIDYTDTEMNEAQVLSDFIENISDITAVNGINWIEDIITKRYQIVGSEMDTDTEDVVIEPESGINITEPAVTTSAVSGITSTSAVSGGTVTSGGSTTVRGLIWGALTNPVKGVTNYTENGTDEGPFVGTIGSIESPLLPGTTYYVRAYAENASGIAYGQSISFKTAATPTVTTTSTSGVSNSGVTVAGNITNSASILITQSGVAWSVGTNPESDKKVASAAAVQSGPFSIAISGLPANTAHNVWAYATSNGITAYGAMLSITTTNLNKPTLTTMPITGNTTSATTGICTAISGGNISSNGGGAITASGIVWSTSENPTTALSTKTQDGTATGVFSSNMASLTPGTTYYVRAYATNSMGTAYGNELNFTAQVIAPIVKTGTAGPPSGKNIAISDSEVVSSGGSSITARGVVWSTSPSPTIANSKATDASNAIGKFSTSVTGLSPVTTYYLRAYATNSEGTSYGSQITFTTIASIPTVSTKAITNERIIAQGDAYGAFVRAGAPAIKLNVNYAQSGGTISDNGGAPITEYGVVWIESTSGDPSIANTKTYKNTLFDYSLDPLYFDNAGYSYVDANGDPWTTGAKYIPQMPIKIPNEKYGTTTDWTNTMTELKSGVFYRVRAYAKNSVGIGYGTVYSFGVANTGNTVY